MKSLILTMLLLNSFSVFSVTNKGEKLDIRFTCIYGEAGESISKKQMCTDFYNSLIENELLKQVKSLGIKNIFIKFSDKNDEEGSESISEQIKIKETESQAKNTIEFSVEDTFEIVKQTINYKKNDFEQARLALALGIDSFYCDEYSIDANDCVLNVERLIELKKSLGIDDFTFNSLDFTSNWDESSIGDQSPSYAFFNINESDKKWTLNINLLLLMKEMDTKLNSIELLLEKGNTKIARTKNAELEKDSKEKLNKLLIEIKNICGSDEVAICNTEIVETLYNNLLASLDFFIVEEF